MNFLISLRIILFFVFMGLFTGAFQIGATSILDAQDAEDLYNEFTETMNDSDSSKLILNNLALGLPSFIPGFGPAWGLYSGWSTGISFSAIVSMVPDLKNFQSLDIFYGSPYGFIELIAYSIAMSRGTLLVYNFIKKTDRNSVIVWTIVEVSVVIALIAIGGVIESALIEPETLTIDDL